MDRLVGKVLADKVVALASRLIRIPSINPPGNTEEIAAFIADYLSRNGVSAELHEPSPGKVNVVARIGEGCEGEALILNGHMDVVPVGDESKWSFPPLSGEVRDGFLLGRGSSDMKGGLAGMIEAFIAAAELEKYLSRPIVLACVADEESGGEFGSSYLVERGITRGAGALIAEPTGLNWINVGEKGVFWSRIKMRGKPGHGSLSPYFGENAIIKACEVIRELLRVTEIKTSLPSGLDEVLISSRMLIEQFCGKGTGAALDHVTVNIGVIRGGVKINVIPDFCELEVDMRIPIGLSSSKIMDFIKDILEKYGGELEVISSSEPNYNPPDCEIFRFLKKAVLYVLGLDAKPFIQMAASDARFYRAYGIPTVHYGPGELETIHGYDERVKVEDLVKFAKVYAGLIAEYSLQSS